MDPLRASLIVVGIAILVAVYVWSARRRRRRRSRYYRWGSVANTSGVGGAGKASGGEPLSPKVRRGDRRGEDQDEAISAEDARELQALDNLIQQRDAEPATLELDLGQPPDDRGNAKAHARQPDVEPQAKRPELVVMHVLAHEGHTISGGALLRELTNAGLKFGSMGIFHYFETEPSGGNPVFSVANMLEPGRLDPDTMASFNTPGVVLFMQLSAVSDPGAGYEKMLATGQALAAAVRGRLCDETRSALTAPVIERTRQRIKAYQGGGNH